MNRSGLAPRCASGRPRPRSGGLLIAALPWFCCTRLLGGIGLLVSRSAAKDLQPPDRMSENLGIMRFRFVWMRAIRAFVADLDTRSLFWSPLALAWLPVVLAWLPAAPAWLLVAFGQRAVSGRAPSGRLLHEDGDVLARGCPYCTRAGPSWSTPDCRPVAPDPRAVRAERHQGHQARPFPARRPPTPTSGGSPHRCLGCPDPQPLKSHETTQRAKASADGGKPLTDTPKGQRPVGPSLLCVPPPSSSMAWAPSSWPWWRRWPWSVPPGYGLTAGTDGATAASRHRCGWVVRLRDVSRW